MREHRKSRKLDAEQTRGGRECALGTEWILLENPGLPKEPGMEVLYLHV